MAGGDLVNGRAMKSSGSAICITFFVSIVLAYDRQPLDVSYRLDQARTLIAARVSFEVDTASPKFKGITYHLPQVPAQDQQD